MTTLTKFIDFFTHRTSQSKGYIQYLTAIKLALKIGNFFQTDEKKTYKVIKFIRHRPDISRYFSGYECVLDGGTK